MRKRFGLLAGLTIMALLAVGCGGNKEAEEDSSEEDAVIIEDDDEEEEDNDNLVSMEKTTEDDKSSITNIMGDKTAGADVIIVNDTGLEISEFYCRPSGEEDWNDDYINKAFTLKNGDKALLYYDPNAKDEDGESITAYDLRVNFTKEDESTCMFRNLPLSDMEELQLKMEDGVPFVTYTSLSTKRKVSTLEDAKARMGLTDDDEDSDEEENQDSDYDSSPETDTTSETEESEKSSSSSYDSDDNNNTNDTSYDSSASSNYDSSDSSGTGTSNSYVGDSMDSVEGQLGSPNSSEYDTDPETGATVGYYYYDGYTVETIEQNGEEVVTGVW